MTRADSTARSSEMPTCTSLLVMGGGVMGKGIARLFASAGIQVTLVDNREVTFSHPGVTVARRCRPTGARSRHRGRVRGAGGEAVGVYAQVEAAYGGRSVAGDQYIRTAARRSGGSAAVSRDGSWRCISFSRPTCSR